MTQAMNPAAAQLRGTANGIAFRRYGAERARGGIQHALAEALLGAVPPTRQRIRFVAEAEHAGNAARRMPSLRNNSDLGRRVVFVRC